MMRASLDGDILFLCCENSGSFWPFSESSWSLPSSSQLIIETVGGGGGGQTHHLVHVLILLTYCPI